MPGREGDGGNRNTRAIVSSYVGVLVYAALVFLAAWRVVYWQGILYTVLAVAGVALTHGLVPAGSTLATERAGEARAGRDWDKRLLGAFFLVNVVMFVTAGLDSGRFGWTGGVPIGVTAAGVALMVLGQVLFAVARRQNAFFSSTVRIQTERGHRVCDAGLYRAVRHPGYLGMLMSLLAFPLVLNSFWAFVPAGIASMLLLARTWLEDRVLLDELSGYREYADNVRWRLIPGVF